ncbi:MAG: electron transfer flavoprotein-ubiquinone oxidoreductase [Gammaproteobacteria bacterium]|nr:electron transfer flavoprotein-ubiquinone oxidoreductase [Gammaproteobacteria bacterium]
MSGTERDVMHYDVIVVGAGPAGLACAIRLRQLNPERSVCVIEKGASLGAHILSGSIVDPAPLDQLLPTWREQPPALCVPVLRDRFQLLSARRAWHLPTPPQQHNHGCFILSLGQLVIWLGTQAESAGVDVFTGFAAAAPLFDAAGAVAGVQLGDMGRTRDGGEGPNFSAGAELRAPLTVLAEGCRGSLSKQLIARYGLDAGRSPPTYALGFKELWQLPPGRVEPGLVRHCVGWPLDRSTYGGGFVYHLTDNQVYVGFTIGLDYADPYLDPFEVFQRFKHHPSVRSLLAGGELQEYGARTIAAGGWQSLPRLDMPGALLIGDAAGLLNFARLKGVHQALRSGMLAAEHITGSGGSSGFDARLRDSVVGRELRKVRNIKPGFSRGLWSGLANGALETLLAGHSPWTLSHRANDATLRRIDAVSAPGPAPERTLPPRDRTAAVYLAQTVHNEQQPVHLKVADTDLCVDRCAREYANPCTRFCPAGVYEMVDDGTGRRRLQINAANCVHCKACDIKDPYRQITWTTPEGGSGPNYHDF